MDGDEGMEETLNIIKRRYIHEKAIYTWCGIALVAVNPYQEQDIYGEQAVETYHSAPHSVYLQLDPHIYAVTEDAYSKLERNLKDQSIIVSGESGAGKTVSAKHAMRYLASIASSKAKLQIENRVLASNPIMEAIGNASTVRNDNSSRFGKYIQIYFDRHNRRILGGNMRTYLLEKSRVTKQQVGERNFHIFYQLLSHALKNPGQMSHLKLVDENGNSLRKFNFLGGLEPVESRDDLRRFSEALKTLNIDQRRVDIIYRIIAAILHGGNIDFEMIDHEEEDSSCTINTENLHFRACCELLGLDLNETKKRLTTKLLKTGAKEVIEQPLTRYQAEYARDAMLKYIYEFLFTWLVGLINLSLEGNLKEEQLQQQQQQQSAILKSPSTKKSILDKPQEPQFIGVLDIYGFENFKTNSFEQFCINYANEVLQQQYNQHVFKLEQEEYIREGIDWTFIEYSDNQPVIDIIESKPIGILNLLDEECRMPKGSDESWCAKLYDHLLPGKSNGSAAVDNQTPGSCVFRKPKLNYQNSFSICHYAEEVTYNVETFLEKNRDTISEEQCELLRRSNLINYIFEDPLLSSTATTSSASKELTVQDLQPPPTPSIFTTPPRSLRGTPMKGGGSGGGSKSATVGYQFRGSLAALISTLNKTEPHYIRCIKPNDEKKAFKFDEERAVQQLKACGVYETIRISNNGFPLRWPYKDFAKRYRVLSYGHLTACSGTDLRSICGTICEIAYNKNSIYSHLRTKHEQAYIDKLVERHGDKPSAIYQFGKSKIFFRAGQMDYLERIRSHRLREFTITIQRHVRGWLARCAFIRLREEYLEELHRQRLQEYTLTIQRHVRGWLARKSFTKRREQFLEEVRREAELSSVQNQLVSSGQPSEFEADDSNAHGGSDGAKENGVSRMSEEEEAAATEAAKASAKNIDREDSLYQLVVDMMYTIIQPLIIAAVLEYEALDSPEPFASLESRSLTPTEQPMEDLIKELDKFHDLIVKNCVPEDIVIQAYKQLFYLICAQSLNQLLIRRDLCQFRKAMQISFNLSCLIQWCRERFLVNWREIVEQLDPITQATKLLQTRKSSEDIATIAEVCNKLRPSQIIKILNMYTSSYEEQISTDFIHELEEYLNRSRTTSIANIWL